MSKIRVMDEILANKIAAGEVIEKCVSIVKELVENSIDAKSTKIKVDLINSGVTEIKVTDDGIGMDENDALLAFQRHATSKLLSEIDLFIIIFPKKYIAMAIAIYFIISLNLMTVTPNIYITFSSFNIYIHLLLVYYIFLGFNSRYIGFSSPIIVDFPVSWIYYCIIWKYH